MTWPPEIQRRMASRSAPYANEGLRLPVIMDWVAKLTREGIIAGGMTGVDDILLSFIAELVSWYESRQGVRDQVALQHRQEMDQLMGPEPRP